MISRPPPPRGYKYNPVNGKLEKKPKGIRTVAKRRRRRRKRRGGNIAKSTVPVAKAVLELAKKLHLIK